MSELQITSCPGGDPATETGENCCLKHRDAANEPVAEQEAARKSTGSKRLHVPIAFLLVLAIVAAGSRYHSYLYLTPEQGTGYALGIIGASLMLMLLLYPLRKHAQWAQRLGPVRYWFRSHMIMGVIGPVCILFHCNYKLGSTNGNIALFSMLLVAGSGLVGRYFYTKIHYGMYGRKADLAHLNSDAVLARTALKPVYDQVPVIKERLQRLEDVAMSNHAGFLLSLIYVLVVNARSRWCWYVTGSDLRKYFNSADQREKYTNKDLRNHYSTSRKYLSSYLYTVRKVAGFSFYERLFSLWHILHLPLFVMLLITGIIHVYAVHMY